MHLVETVQSYFVAHWLVLVSVWLHLGSQLMGDFKTILSTLCICRTIKAINYTYRYDHLKNSTPTHFVRRSRTLCVE
jgi:hypothetical protein